MTLPVVSALIDTYNQAHFLEQTLTSVLEQGLSTDELEIVVVDDGSTDNTSQLVAKFAPRVRYLRKQNGGQISAYNAAVPETHAPIIAFLDADDWWAKEKLTTILPFFEKEPAVTAVGHGFVEFYDETRAEQIQVPETTYHLDLSSSKAARLAHSGRRFLSTSKMAVRRSVLDAVGTLPDSLVFFDVAVQLIAMALGPAVILDQVLTFYRIHGQNLYESQDPAPQNLRRRIQCLDAQLDFLPLALAKLGVLPDALSAIMKPDELERDRLRIKLHGGWPWETFHLELRRFRATYEHHSLPYRVFKWLALTPTLFMSPDRFYRLRSWYAKHNLRRFRKFVGEPTPMPEIGVKNPNR